ncbi:MAG: hypothetical protein U0359_22350 [Byssovorax sp.]
MDIDLDLLEALALSDDRAPALEALLPGTAVHDYRRGIELQHQGKLDEVDALIEGWKARYPNEDEAFARLRRRQLLLRAGADLATHAEAIRFEAGLRFDDQAEAEAAAQRYPSRLDPAVISPDALRRDALSRASDLSCFTAWSLDTLVSKGGALGMSRIRELLGRLPRANVKGLVELIARELADSASGGFRALALAPQLTLEQLQALVKQRPQLRQDGAWVEAVMARLCPPAHVDITIDREARGAYLDALAAFVDPLPAGFATLKAQVLYHRLDLDRALGVYDRDRFLRYLGMPRAQPYVDGDWIRRLPSDQVARPGWGGPSAPLLESFGNDEELVRDYLHHFLVTEEMDAFAERIRRDWLTAELATARLLAGDPDTRRWTALLSEGALASLRERVDIELSCRNPPCFAADEAVRLEVLCKNVPELTVKVFRINALAYFLGKGGEIDTDIDLDGMIAGDERTVTIDAPSIRRTAQSVDLPGCARPGTYVVELIGNGRASRALIRKGSLRAVSRVGAAGVTVTVLDEQGRPLPDARLWMGGQELSPREDGAITIPFSTQPGERPVLLVHGDLAQRETLYVPAERYALDARFELDRQALVAGKNARILLRPRLSIAPSSPVPIALLEEPALEISVVDLKGVPVQKTLPLTLREDAEAVAEIWVPEDTVKIGLRLRGRVRVVSTQQTVDLEDTMDTGVNEVHQSSQTEAMHLGRTADGHVLYLLGKSGEPRAGRAVPITLTHAAVTFGVAVTLATDERGRIELGPLPGVRTISAGGSSWSIWPEVSAPDLLGAASGATITLPAPPFLDPEELPRAVSLVELRKDAALRELGDRVTLDGRLLRVAGLDPGRYRLSVRGFDSPITIEIGPGAVDPATGWSTRGSRMVEITPPLALVQAFAVEGDDIVVRLDGAGPETRVHLIASYFQPSPLPFDRFAETPSTTRPVQVPPRRSRYVSGRDIGDEYRYVLARRTATRRPGMLLDKPSLLLNPWALRTTSNQVQVAASGSAFGPAGAPPGMAMPKPQGPRGGSADPSQGGITPSYDFLAAPAVVIDNLRPDGGGVVRVPRTRLGDAQTVRAIVVDRRQASSADLPSPRPRRPTAIAASASPSIPTAISPRSAASRLPRAAPCWSSTICAPARSSSSTPWRGPTRCCSPWATTRPSASSPRSCAGLRCRRQSSSASTASTHATSSTSSSPGRTRPSSRAPSRPTSPTSCTRPSSTATCSAKISPPSPSAGPWAASTRWRRSCSRAGTPSSGRRSRASSARPSSGSRPTPSATRVSATPCSDPRGSRAVASAARPRWT